MSVMHAPIGYTRSLSFAPHGAVNKILVSLVSLPKSYEDWMPHPEGMELLATPYGEWDATLYGEWDATPTKPAHLSIGAATMATQQQQQPASLTFDSGGHPTPSSTLVTVTRISSGSGL